MFLKIDFFLFHALFYFLLFQLFLSTNINRLSNALKDEKVRQEINRAVEDGSTALHLAIWKENVDIARILIENGANLEKATANGFTPLHSAILNEQLDIIELLLCMMRKKKICFRIIFIFLNNFSSLKNSTWSKPKCCR